MSQSLPPACVDCQKLLSFGPDTFDQPDVRTHLAGCAICSRLYAQYCEMDRLLHQIPDLRPLPDLALRLQQLPQAQTISELQGSFASWEGMLEEKSSAHLFKPWLDEPAISPFSQGKQTMQKQTIASQTRPSNALNNGQFQPPLNPTPRPRRSLWRVIASTAVVLLALVTIFAWMLLPRLTPPSAPAGQGEATPTTAPATPMPGLTQQYTFTAQDSGKTVRYGVTTRFSLRLNQQQYPHQNLQLSCSPQGALSSITNVPYAAPPFYAVAYQANEVGTCTLKNGSFVLAVIITGDAQTPTPVSSPTQVSSATSTPGLTQQYEFRVQDSGKTVRYGVTTRFSIILNQQQYPKQNFQVSCSPQGALGDIMGVPYAAPPFYAVSYQANEAGTCTLKNGSFILTVVIVQ